MMLTVICLLALLVISLAVATPAVTKSIQRDRDLETWHRGLQYRRAIQLYYRKFHAYPPNADALVNTNEIHFLRKKYNDPVTGKGDWKPVLFGQNKAPMSMGFFGQALGGNASTMAGVGPSGGSGLGTNPPGGGNSLGSGSAFGGGFSLGSPGTSGSQPPTTSQGSAFGSSGGFGSSPGSSSSSGQTFGGAGIVGFSPASPKQSILVYKKKNHYNEWEFTYDPISDMPVAGGGNTGAIGQPASSTTSPVGSSPFANSGFGNSGSNGSGFGSGGSGPGAPGAGSSPISPQ